MRSAYEKGFEVLTLTDAVGATSLPEHENAISYDYPMFSKPTTTAEFVAGLAGAEVAADTSRGY
jgi:nicotinamidase-related amidase